MPSRSHGNSIERIALDPPEAQPQDQSGQHSGAFSSQMVPHSVRRPGPGEIVSPDHQLFQLSPVQHARSGPDPEQQGPGSPFDQRVANRFGVESRGAPALALEPRPARSAAGDTQGRSHSQIARRTRVPAQSGRLSRGSAAGSLGSGSHTASHAGIANKPSMLGR